MKKYYLDTSFLIDILRERKSALDIHKNIKGREVTGSVSIYELSKFSGQDFFQLLQDKEIIMFDSEDAEIAGEIYRDLK